MRHAKGMRQEVSTVLQSRKPARVTLVVLGDLGRSPRMQYHALALAREGICVDIVAYEGASPIPELLAESRIRLLLVRPPRLERRHELPRPAFLAYSAARAVVLLVRLQVLLARAPRPDIVLVQNPPALPTLLSALLAARFRRARLLVDWHNFGFTMLALALGADHPVVGLARRLELWLGRRADANLCVSEAMRAELERRGIGPVHVLYDRPAEPFTRDDAGARAVVDRLLEETGLGDGPRPAILVSPTSWTADEDFTLLLDAIRHIEETADERRIRLLVLVTGSGPMRERFEAELARLPQRVVAVRTVWLEPDDYPRLLRGADLGLCFHRSSSGVDLPMKIADMFGAGIPVCAFDYGPCLAERLHDGENGLLFRTGLELADHIRSLFDGSGGPSSLLTRLQRGVEKEAGLTWAQGWAIEAWPVIEAV